MDAISYTAARANLAKTMEKVCNDHTPIIITRKREAAVVMLSLDDYQALEETAYSTASPGQFKAPAGIHRRTGSRKGHGTGTY